MAGLGCTHPDSNRCVQLWLVALEKLQALFQWGRHCLFQTSACRSRARPVES